MKTLSLQSIIGLRGCSDALHRFGSTEKSYITTMNDKGEIVGQKKLPTNGEVVEFLKEFYEVTESFFNLSELKDELLEREDVIIQ